MDKNNYVTFRCTVEGSGGWLNKKVSPPKQQCCQQQKKFTVLNNKMISK
jgi:hypothetical protein